jgi:two-component system, LuxR family, sensor kinase FixL
VPEAPSHVSFTTFLQAVLEDDRAATRQAFEEAIALRQAYEIRFRVMTVERGLAWIVALGRVLHDESGTAARLLGVNIDVTERLRAEEQEQQQRQQLAQLSRLSVMGELSGALAHELNQPLTAIMSTAQAVRRDLEQGKVDIADLREALEDILAEDRRASAVIRHIRDLLQRGRIELASVDVNATIRTVLALERTDLAACKVSIELDLAPDIPSVEADQVHLQQVLLNLILNARDALAGNQAGERFITVRTLRAGDDRVEILVSDNGEGIAQQNQKVFEAFYSTKPHGLGLGLAICRTIVTAHHGRLWFAANAGGGTTFHVTLPLRHATGNAIEHTLPAPMRDRLGDPG